MCANVAAGGGEQQGAHEWAAFPEVGEPEPASAPPDTNLLIRHKLVDEVPAPSPGVGFKKPDPDDSQLCIICLANNREVGFVVSVQQACFSFPTAGTEPLMASSLPLKQPLAHH